MFSADWVVVEDKPLWGGIDVTIDGGVVAAYLSGANLGSALVSRWDEAGTKQWSLVMMPIDGVIHPTQLAVDADDNGYLVGWHLGIIDLGEAWIASPATCPDCGSHWTFLVKFSPNGTVIWTKAWAAALATEPGEARIQQVVPTATGELILAGVVRGTYDFGLGLLTGEMDADMFVLKLDDSGNPLWNRRFGSDGSERHVHDLAVGDDGSIAFTGWIDGEIDFGPGAPPLLDSDGVGFVAVLDADGQHIWSRGSVNGAPWGVDFDSSGNVYVAAACFDAPSASSGCLSRLEGSAGTLEWMAEPAEASGVHALHVGVDVCDNVIAMGQRADVIKRGPQGEPLADMVFAPDLFDDQSPDRTYSAVSPQGVVYHAYYYEDGLDLGTGPLTGGPGPFLVRFSQY